MSYFESVAEAAPNTPLFYYHYPGERSFLSNCAPSPLCSALSLIKEPTSHHVGQSFLTGMTGVNIPLYDFFALAIKRVPTLQGE